MEMNKEIAANMLKMLQSEDKENAYVAFQALEAHTFQDDEIGYLIYLYKFGKYDLNEWQQSAPNSHKRLCNFITNEQPLTYGKGLGIMIAYKNKKEIVEMFLEAHVIELSKMLGIMGYPVEQLDISIKLKK